MNMFKIIHCYKCFNKKIIHGIAGYLSDLMRIVQYGEG